ncbi:MAG: hypothetical protein H0T98_00925 [Euzebyaceae bacterium]|jgi:hypothetical protein|nr:hypothetical protein [Euzebyaceae bacterium]
MRLPALTIWMVALLVAACAGGTGPPASGGAQGGGGQGGGAQPGSEPSDEPTVAGPSVDPSELRELAKSARKGKSAGGRQSMTLTGTLGRDETLEGGCAWLEADGRRWQVIYPHGYRLDVASGALFGPDGKIAGNGDTVTVQGAEAPDMATTCQVGPVFRATSVEA